MIPIEALSDLEGKDIPMLDVRDSMCRKRNVYLPRVSEHLHAPPEK